MDYNDQYILSLIKRQESLIIYLLSVVGKGIQASLDLASLIQSGTGDPNLAGVVPTNPAVGGFYRQTDIDGNTIATWIWTGSKWD